MAKVTPLGELKDIERRGERTATSGAKIIGGSLYRSEDYNPLLRGRAAAETFEEMRLGDAEVSASLMRLMWPLLSANWVVEPADDTDEEKEIAEFCEKWIFGDGRMDPLAMRRTAILRSILMMMADGFSALEVVWGTSEGRQVYDQLVPIAASTVWEFNFSKDGRFRPESILQRGWTPDGWKEVTIPMEKVALFVFAREGDNLWGWPILRAAYPAWFYKKMLLRVDAQRHERFGMGIPVMTLPMSATEEQRAAAQLAMKNLRAHEYQYVVKDEGFEFELVQPTGTGTDIIGSVKYFDSQISQAMYSEVMHLGASESGSRAVASSKVDMMLSALQSVANEVEEGVNAQLVVPLVYRNWGKREKYPSLKCEDLSKLAGPVLADTLSKLMNANVGAITPGPDIEERLREELQLPPIPDDVKKLLEQAHVKAAEMKANPPDPMELAAAGAKAAQPKPGENAPPPGGKPAAKPPAPPAEKADVATAVPQEASRFWRGPMAHEEHVDFGRMADHMDTEPTRLWHRVVKPFRDQQIAAIAKAAGQATPRQLAAGIYSRVDRAPRVTRMTNELAAALVPTYLEGRRSVLRDRAAQVGVAKAAGDYEDLGPDDEDIEPKQSQLAWVKNLALAFVSAQTAALIAEAVRAGTSAHQVDKAPAEVEADVRRALEALSEPVVMADLAGTTITTFTNGRVEQGQAMADEIASVYYSAVMDDATCAPCAALDGSPLEVESYDAVVPNTSGCDGGDRCRCIPIFVFKAEQKEAA